VAILAEVTRGGRIESRHDGVVVVVDVTGKAIAAAGDPETVAFFRSSAKPFQAVPLVESGAADRFGFDGAETALGCASHNASIEHQRRVAGILEKIGLGEEHLRCGFSPPADEREAARLTLGIKRASQIQCECSGEHAGMLAACVHLGYPVEGYNERDHPLQRRVLEIVAGALRLEPAAISLGVDGCSLPTFGAPLRTFATAYATLAVPDRAPADSGKELANSLDRLRSAMLAQPEMISGEGVLDTDLMRLSGGRIVAKLGAEGLLCLAVPERGWGIAIKILDGMPRALAPAALATLEQLNLLDGETLDRLREWHCGPVKSFRGEPVGELRPVLSLSFSA